MSDNISRQAALDAVSYETLSVMKREKQYGHCHPQTARGIGYLRSLV